MNNSLFYEVLSIPGVEVRTGERAMKCVPPHLRQDGAGMIGDSNTLLATPYFRRKSAWCRCLILGLSKDSGRWVLFLSKDKELLNLATMTFSARLSGMTLPWEKGGLSE